MGFENSGSAGLQQVVARETESTYKLKAETAESTSLSRLFENEGGYSLSNFITKHL